MFQATKSGINRTLAAYLPNTRNEWSMYLRTLLPIVLSSIVSQASVLMAILLTGSLGPADTNSAAIAGYTQYSNFAILYNAVFGAVQAVMVPALTQNIRTANQKTLNTIMGTIMQMQLVVFALILVFNLLAAPEIAAKITTSEAVGYFRTYSSIVVCSLFFQSFYSVHVAALIARGKSMIAVFVSAFEVLTNLMFNLIFLFAVKQSVTLLAISSLEASAVVAVAVTIFVYFTDKGQITHPFVYLSRNEIGLASDQRIYTASLYKYLAMKIPALLFSFIWAWEAIAKNLIWAFGDDWNGANGATGLKSSYAISPYYGLTWMCLSFMGAVSQIVPCYVGRQLGEKNYASAVDHSRKLIGLAAIVGFFSVVILVLCAVTVPQTDFVRVDDKYREVGTVIMLVNAFTAVFWVHQGLFITFMLAGGKNVFMSLFILVLGIGQIGWEWAVVLMHKYGGALSDFRAAYFVFTLFEVPASVGYFLLWKKRLWMRRIVIA